MKRVIFYCDTIYQVFTALNIIIDKHNEQECDIALYHQFNSSQELSRKLSNCRLINNVYDFYPPNNKKEDVQRLIKSNKHLTSANIRDLSYDMAYFACLDTSTSLALYSSLRCKKYLLYDDGTGSYRGNIINDNMSWKRRLVLKLTHPLRDFFRFDKYYLYSPEISRTEITILKEKINVHDNSDIKKIFGYVENDLYKGKAVFLEQPYIKEYRAKNDEIVNEVLGKYLSNNIIIRLHPRMKESNFAIGAIDDINNLWELECIHQIDSDNVLISIFSTAVFQPRIIAEKDLHIILLYKLYREVYDDNDRSNIDAYVNTFITAFPLTDVFVPESIDQLESALSSLNI